MALTVENAGALCPGINSPEAVMAEQIAVKITRNVIYNGEELKAGSTVNLPKVVALGFISVKKAEKAASGETPKTIKAKGE